MAIKVIAHFFGWEYWAYLGSQGVTPGALDQFLGVGEASKKDPDQGIQKSIKDN